LKGSVPIITLLTDFGLEDEFVGVMKGVILSIHPRVNIVDITHQVPPQGVLQAARTLSASYPYFPKGTVHVIVVDPGVGTARKIIGLQKDDQFFIAPDNGVLTFLYDTQGVQSIVAVENEAFFLSPVSRTFHGRDIMAPVAAHLSKGSPLSCLGTAVSDRQLVRIEVTAPFISPGKGIRGSITTVDHFGNLITDIHKELLESLMPNAGHGGVMIHVAGMRIAGLSPGYQSRKKGDFLALINSRNQLEIAVCCGSAQQRLPAQVGDKVEVTVAKKPLVD
jgi:hypothetical protein